MALCCALPFFSSSFFWVLVGVLGCDGGRHVFSFCRGQPALVDLLTSVPGVDHAALGTLNARVRDPTNMAHVRANTVYLFNILM